MKNVMLNCVSLLLNAPVSGAKGVCCRQVAATVADLQFSDDTCLNICKKLAPLMKFFCAHTAVKYCAVIHVNSRIWALKAGGDFGVIWV